MNEVVIGSNKNRPLLTMSICHKHHSAPKKNYRFGVVAIIKLTGLHSNRVVIFCILVEVKPQRVETEREAIAEYSQRVMLGFELQRQNTAEW